MPLGVFRSVFWIEQPAAASATHQIWSGTVTGKTSKVAVLTSDLTRPQNLVYDLKTDRCVLMYSATALTSPC